MTSSWDFWCVNSCDVYLFTLNHQVWFAAYGVIIRLTRYRWRHPGSMGKIGNFLRYTVSIFNQSHPSHRPGLLNEIYVQIHVNTCPPVQFAGKLQTTFSIAFSSMKMFKMCLKFPRGLFLRVQLIQLMAWHRTVDKPLSAPMLTQLTDAYMRY